MTELLWNCPPKLLLPKGPPLKRAAPVGKADKKGKKNKKGRKGGGKGKAPESETPPPKKRYYWINGVRKLMPFYEHGYNSSGGEMHDPNSERTRRKNQVKGGPPEGQPKFKAPNPPPKAPSPQVKEISYPPIIGEKVCVLDGSNLGILRDGLGLCAPGIDPPEDRSPKHFGIL